MLFPKLIEMISVFGRKHKNTTTLDSTKIQYRQRIHKYNTIIHYKINAPSYITKLSQRQTVQN